MKSGIADIKAFTFFFMLGIALILRNGRRILSTLRDFKLNDEKGNSSKRLKINLATIVTYPDITTVKSIMFQPDLKYALLWNINPKAMILIMHSRVKIIVETRPQMSK